MRGLTSRMLADKYTVQSNSHLPTNLSELLDYFDETLWLHSHVEACDDMPLLTKSSTTVYALDIIFPNKLTAYFSTKVIDVAIEPRQLPEFRFQFIGTTDANNSRFASHYELTLLNDARKSSISQPPFILTNGGHESFRGKEALELMIAYRVKVTLGMDISLLSHKAKIQRFFNKAQIFINIAPDINKELQNKCEQGLVVKNDAEKIKMELNGINNDLTRIQVILSNSIEKLDHPTRSFAHTLSNLPQIDLLDLTLSPEVAIETYLDIVSAKLILIDREHGLKLIAITEFCLAKMTSLDLETLLAAAPKNENKQRTGPGLFNNRTATPKEELGATPQAKMGCKP